MDVSKDKGIKGLYCIDDKKIIVYMFDKDKWDSMAECQEWMKEHMGKTFEPHEVSQREIIDEIDYLITLIDKEGISDGVKERLQDLAKRLPADDIAVIDIVKDVPLSIVGDVKQALTSNDILESIKRIGGK